jgi:hypothetical protein
VLRRFHRALALRPQLLARLGEEGVVHLHDHFDLFGADVDAGQALPFADFGVCQGFRAGAAACGQIPEPIPDVLGSIRDFVFRGWLIKPGITLAPGLAVLVRRVVPDEKADRFSELLGQF